jgi:hypothetical protein
MRRLAVTVVLGGALALPIACERGDRLADANTMPRDPRIPNPDARPRTFRTTDSTGFVDNAGRPSEQRARTETSGMRATETGSEHPTGTPGSGWPLPGRLDPPSARGEGAGAAQTARGNTGPRPAGGPEHLAISRLARALCDHEAVCGRIGGGRAHESEDVCMMHERVPAREHVLGASCPQGLDQVQLGVCLVAVRNASCDADLRRPETLPECATNALCAPP